MRLSRSAAPEMGDINGTPLLFHASPLQRRAGWLAMRFSNGNLAAAINVEGHLYGRRGGLTACEERTGGGWLRAMRDRAWRPSPSHGMPATAGHAFGVECGRGGAKAKAPTPGAKPRVRAAARRNRTQLRGTVAHGSAQPRAHPHPQCGSNQESRISSACRARAPSGRGDPGAARLCTDFA